MELIIYLLKVNIALVLFYGTYYFLFRQDTFFQWKRPVLLAIIFISFLYPAIDLPRQLIANQELKNVLETVHIPVYYLPEAVITGNANADINLFPKVIIAIYILIFALLFIRMLFQIGTIPVKLRHTTRKVLFGQTVYESRGMKTPFSFFRWIVLDPSRYSETELREILLHETAHVKQKHSVDTIAAELMCILCWFNPFAWLLRTEIRMNLEFSADHSVLASGCGAEHYQFHLLRLTYPKAAAKITNNFNVSLLKKRIFMMNKKETSYRSLWKYALILPVIALLLFFNSMFQTQAAPVNEMNYNRQNPVTTQDEPNRKIFDHVEAMPQFPGGTAALLKWLQENIVYPTEAAQKCIQGRVVVRFVVTPDGSIEDIEVKKSLDPLCDNEALRVVKTMPQWIPGKQDGNPVYVYYSLPIVFRLQPAEKPVK
ncbi:MAG: M56 family metallopeptidase [Candidatus Azobacteroides sp.]|nr:M56 family metallopeptidase [Candidatus Azobacteroides sp.]